VKKTGAKLMFATTTPVPEPDAAKYVKDSEAPYNETARKIMEQEGVAINDLWALASARQAELQIPRNVHFRQAGSVVLAKQGAAAICEAVGTR